MSVISESDTGRRCLVPVGVVALTDPPAADAVLLANERALVGVPLGHPLEGKTCSLRSWLLTSHTYTQGFRNLVWENLAYVYRYLEAKVLFGEYVEAVTFTGVLRGVGSLPYDQYKVILVLLYFSRLQQPDEYKT